MKKLIIVLLFVLALSNLGWCKDFIYKALEFTVIGENAVDCYLTRYASHLPGFVELNPAGKFIYGSDLNAVVFTAALSVV